MSTYIMLVEWIISTNVTLFVHCYSNIETSSSMRRSESEVLIMYTLKPSKMNYNVECIKTLIEMRRLLGV